jgi:copper chaperone CopZ
MRLTKWSTALCVSAVLACSGAARAETKVELKNCHLCCGACVKAVAATLKDVEGVKPACDQKARTITITAKDDAAAWKAIDALATAGFHGDSDHKELKIKDDSGATAGKVKSLTLTGAHNCCGQCSKAIKAVVAKVPGVTGDTAKSKGDTFEVKGDFDAAELVKALNEAGFHVKVKK